MNVGNPPPSRQNNETDITFPALEKPLAESKFSETSKLPQKILEHVLSYLRRGNYAKCSRVNKRWNETIVKIALNRELELIDIFFKYVLEFQKKWETQPGKESFVKLKEIKNHLDFSKVTTIPQLRISLHCEKTKYMIAMGQLEGSELGALINRGKSLALPWHFHDVFGVKVWKGAQRHAINSMVKLIKNGFFDKVSEVAAQFHEEPYAFGIISLELIKKEQYDQAYEIAGKLGHDKDSQEVLKSIFRCFLKKEQVDKGLVLKKRHRKISSEHEDHKGMSSLFLKPMFDSSYRTLFWGSGSS